MRMSVRVALVAVTAALSMIVAASAGADPFVGPPICSSAGMAVSGTHSS